MAYEFDEHRRCLSRLDVLARRIIDASLGESRSAIEPELLAWGAPVAAELRRLAQVARLTRSAWT